MGETSVFVIVGGISSRLLSEQHHCFTGVVLGGAGSLCSLQLASFGHEPLPSKLGEVKTIWPWCS